MISLVDRFQSIASAISLFIIDLVAIMGLSIDTDLIVDVISAIVFIIATAYGIWKNHNFTDAAIEGQRLINALKSNIDLPADSMEDGTPCIVWKIPIVYGDVDEDKQ